MKEKLRYDYGNAGLTLDQSRFVFSAANFNRFLIWIGDRHGAFFNFLLWTYGQALRILLIVREETGTEQSDLI